MNSSTTSEVIVGSCGLMFASIVIDDPALEWLAQNGVRVGLVGFCSAFVALVICLLVPATTARQFVGRILAGGVFGSAATAAAGSIHASGNGAAATAGVILFAGIAGWLIMVAIYQYIEAKRNSGELVGWVGSVFDRLLSKGNLPALQKGSTDGPGATTVIRQVNADRGPDAGGNASQSGQRLPVEQTATGPAPAGSHGNRAIEGRGEQEVSNKTPGT